MRKHGEPDEILSNRRTIGEINKTMHSLDDLASNILLDNDELKIPPEIPNNAQNKLTYRKNTSPYLPFTVNIHR